MLETRKSPRSSLCLAALVALLTGVYVPAPLHAAVVMLVPITTHPANAHRVTIEAAKPHLAVPDEFEQVTNEMNHHLDGQGLPLSTPSLAVGASSQPVVQLPKPPHELLDSARIAMVLPAQMQFSSAEQCRLFLESLHGAAATSERQADAKIIDQPAPAAGPHQASTDRVYRTISEYAVRLLFTARLQASMAVDVTCQVTTFVNETAFAIANQHPASTVVATTTDKQLTNQTMTSATVPDDTEYGYHRAYYYDAGRSSGEYGDARNSVGHWLSDVSTKIDTERNTAEETAVAPTAVRETPAP